MVQVREREMGRDELADFVARAAVIVR
ncbi:hypothetical protein MKD33_17360, partial [Chromobacterium piscinae]